MALPDVLIIGSPKAGSTALHAALALHPQLAASTVKEPKYFLCADAPPDRAFQRGPGDRHSSREWVWRREDYEALFDTAPAGTLRFESTPFYLWDRAAHVRMARAVPDAKLLAVIRDPVDRAFSNWTHLWADGLEPEADFLTAVAAEEDRVARGWAPFWRYVDLGRYGGQLRHLFRHYPPAQVKVVRYKRLVDEPVETLDDICRFLGVDTGVLSEIPRSNLGRWAPDTPVNSVLRRAVRAGASVGQWAHPGVWRAAERRVLRVLQRGDAPRPTLSAADRRTLLPRFAEDNALLCDLLGDDYADWMSGVGRGTFTVRRS
ncbi:sulfotransferase family protein [Jatrophihabitans sp. YIM 134969]